MRPRIQPITPTNRSSEGSMTLEAALIMPVFLLTILFLIYLIQASIASMALNGVLSQSVRQAAAAWYPISEGIKEVQDKPGYEAVQQWSDRLEGITETIGKYGPYLPEPFGEWATEAAEGAWRPDQLAARQVFEQLLIQQMDEHVLLSSRLDVRSVTLPDQGKGEAYLTVEAEYRLPFRFPFTGRKLILHESARERVWIGGEPLRQAVGEAESEPGLISFVSLSPQPIQRGRRIILILQTKPGAEVDLSVVYKSGLSQAKHLGTATADGTGQVSWTWLVSGNTTPGLWEWEASSQTAQLQQTFEVHAKGEKP